MASERSVLREGKPNCLDPRHGFTRAIREIYDLEMSLLIIMVQYCYPAPTPSSSLEDRNSGGSRHSPQVPQKRKTPSCQKSDHILVSNAKKKNINLSYLKIIVSECLMSIYEQIAAYRTFCHCLAFVSCSVLASLYAR